MKNPLNISWLIEEETRKHVGWIMDEIPQFKQILVDDINQVVWMKKMRDGKPAILICPYEGNTFE